MNEKRSRDIAVALLRVLSAGEVNSVMQSEPSFGESENWIPYGDVNKNWDRIGNQTSEPVGALAELIINSIDAILMKKAKEQGWDKRGKKTPQSMIEAVKELYPHIVEGKIATLSPRERTKIAENSVLIGVKRAVNCKKYPTYIIADFGEGQNPDNFSKTLLSLGETNKEGIPFVQGRFNMGSTGSIAFCTQSEIEKGLYKFVLSKRALEDSDGNWGWTLIRTRESRPGEDLPVVEYFCPDGKISRFRAERIHVLGRSDIGVFGNGTVVKLYEYDIGPSAHAVDFGLYQALTTNLLECALPIRIYDFDAKPQSKKGGLRPEGIADRTFSGMKISFCDSDDSEVSDGSGYIDLPTYQVLQSEENAYLGKIRIFATGIKKLPDHIKNCNYRCFYTVNGQAQAKEHKGFFRRAKLDDLYNHLIVQVDCNAMVSTARSAIFKPDRQRMSDNNRSRELRDIVINALSEDPELRQYAQKIRERRVTETIKADEQGPEFWNLLVKDNPELRELLGLGNVISGHSPQGGKKSNKFTPKQFPEYLEVLTPKGNLELPVNTYRRIECETDAENEYLGRLIDPGEFFWNCKELRYSVRLRNGKLKITVWPPDNAIVGESVKVSFGFKDSKKPEPLSREVTVVFTSEAETRNSPSGSNTDTGSGHSRSLSAPQIVWVGEEEWDEHGFNEESGASCSQSDEGVVIYVNKDNKYLLSLLSSEREESGRKIISHMFGFAVGILTLSMYKKFTDKFSDSDSTSNWDDYLKYASSAISAHVVTLIRKLGGQRQ